MEDRIWKLYIHEFPNGKVYIGITHRSVYDRWKNGGIGYKKQKRLWNAIKYYGWDNIIHDVLAIDLTLEEACELEKEWIALYDATNKKFGYNLQLGGSSGLHGEETKKKFSNIAKERFKEPTNHPMYGRHHTKESIEKISEKAKERYKHEKNYWYGKHLPEEVKKKISESRKGFKPSLKTRKKLGEVMSKRVGDKHFASKHVVQIDLKTGKIIAEYESSRIATCLTGIDNTGIQKCCRGFHSQCGGYSWQYKDEPHKYIKKIARLKPVLQYDLNGNFIEEYESVSDAHRKLSIGKSSISRVCRGERESVCGFVFKFKDGDLNG